MRGLGLDELELVLLLAVARRSWGPTAGALARLTGMTRMRVVRTLERLEAVGFVSLERGGAKHWRVRLTQGGAELCMAVSDGARLIDEGVPPRSEVLE